MNGRCQYRAGAIEAWHDDKSGYQRWVSLAIGGGVGHSTLPITPEKHVRDQKHLSDPAVVEHPTWWSQSPYENQVDKHNSPTLAATYLNQSAHWGSLAECG